jgi:hypothetical protein
MLLFNFLYMRLSSLGLVRVSFSSDSSIPPIPSPVTREQELSPMDPLLPPCLGLRSFGHPSPPIQPHRAHRMRLINRSRRKPILPIPIHNPNMFSSLQNDRITSDLPPRSLAYPSTNRKSLLPLFHHHGTERDKTSILPSEYRIKSPSSRESISPPYTECELVGC